MLDALPPDLALAFAVEVRRGARDGRLELRQLRASLGQQESGLRAYAEAFARIRAATPDWLAEACGAPAVRLVAAAADAAPLRREANGTLCVACPHGLRSVADFCWALLAAAEGRLPADGPPSAGPAAIAIAVDVDPRLSPQRAERTGERRGDALLAQAAELGLAGRPWHLWLGPPTPVWLVDPYLQAMGPHLRTWRTREASAAGAPAPSDDDAPEARAAQHETSASAGAGYGALNELAALQAAADAAAAAHRPLAEERRRVQTAAGLHALPLPGVTAWAIDLARVSPTSVHPTVGELAVRAPWAHPAEAPVVVCLPWYQLEAPADVEDEGAALLRRLYAGVSERARGVTLWLPTRAPEADASLTLLRGLWVDGRISQLTLAAQGARRMANLTRRLQAAGAELHTGVAHSASLAHPPAALAAEAAPRLAHGPKLAEVTLAARQTGQLPRAAPFCCALAAPEATGTSVAALAMAGEVLAELLHAEPAATRSTQAGPPAAAEPPPPEPEPQRPARPSLPRHRGPLLRA